MEQYATKGPYPEIRVEGKNWEYARAMLANLAGHTSEIGAIALYFYDSVVLSQSMPDLARDFHQVSITEMRHLDIFGKLAEQLGADPRLWSCLGGRTTYWSPSYNHYQREPVPLLQAAIQGERQAIEQYRKQAGWIQDEAIVGILKRILEDEEEHLALFRGHLQKLITN